MIPRCLAAIAIVIGLLHSRASSQVAVPPADIIDFPSSRQTLLATNPLTFLTNSIHQSLTPPDFPEMPPALQTRLADTVAPASNS